MNIEEFKALALRHAIDALAPEELALFEAAQKELGPEAEEAIREASLVPAALALSLEPSPPHPGRRKKILRAIERMEQP